MMCMNLSDIADLNIKNSYQCCIISGTSKNEAVNVMEITDLREKKQQKFIVIYKNG